MFTGFSLSPSAERTLASLEPLSTASRACLHTQFPLFAAMRLHTSPRLLPESRHGDHCAACHGILIPTRATMTGLKRPAIRLRVATGAVSGHIDRRFRCGIHRLLTYASAHKSRGSSLSACSYLPEVCLIERPPRSRNEVHNPR
jgi:hypothetical protein